MNRLPMGYRLEIMVIYKVYGPASAYANKGG